MRESEIVKFLQSTVLFATAPGSSLRAIAGQLEVINLAEGSVLFQENEVGDAAYLIVEGRLALISENVELIELGPGSCVGEFSLLDDGPRSAMGVARKPLKLLRWRRSQFQRTLADEPVLAQGILRMLTRKLRTDIDRGMDLYLERQRWRQDLARSREIQIGMLPAEHVQLATIEIAGRCIPAQDVGGDFYDYLEYEDGQIGVTIGDVTGHGLHSALFVAIAKSCLHTQSHFNHTPTDIIASLHRAMALSLSSGMLMSCCHVLIDSEKSQLCYANAGHPPPLLYTACNREVHTLEALDPILGAVDVEEMQYHSIEHRWQPGDTLVLYSDGISEAQNPAAEQFGSARIAHLVAKYGHGRPVRLRDAILHAVQEHCHSLHLRDDLTLVVTKGLRIGQQKT